MAGKFFVVLACLALSHASVVKRDAPNVLEDLEKHAKEFQQTVSEQFSKLSSSQTTQEWQNALKEGADSTAAQITSFSASLQAVFADATGKSKEALETALTNMQKTAEDLRKAHPEVEAKAGQLKDQLQAALQNTVQETQKLAKEVSANIEQTNEKLTPKLKEAYDNFVKAAQETQKKLHDVANKQ